MEVGSLFEGVGLVGEEFGEEKSRGGSCGKGMRGLEYLGSIGRREEAKMGCDVM